MTVVVSCVVISSLLFLNKFSYFKSNLLSFKPLLSFAKILD